MSHRLYAVDLYGLWEKWDDHFRLGAVWYRRRRGVTVACIGELWDSQRPGPRDAIEFLERHTDGRYGGDCLGRWDGERYWGAQEPEVMAEHLAILRPMVDSYPTIPAGYDGWWTFQAPKGVL
ncbi:hypothetical protein [Nocardia wallacei]|uniref:hypothetical protein n=1 Tax=Nocardia wallacei TaxID=480035 RepID=UPI002457596E|nr:hypothetical protein [Nocardia wallacei]